MLTTSLPSLPASHVKSEKTIKNNYCCLWCETVSVSIGYCIFTCICEFLFLDQMVGTLVYVTNNTSPSLVGAGFGNTSIYCYFDFTSALNILCWREEYYCKTFCGRLELSPSSHAVALMLWHFLFIWVSGLTSASYLNTRKWWSQEKHISMNNGVLLVEKYSSCCNT